MTTVEHVLADIYVARIEHFVMVGAFSYKVVHVELLQVLAILEGAVVYHHLERCVCIFRGRCTVFEHYFIDVLVAAQGGAVYGNGLVVVGGSYVVVEAHLAIFLVEFFVVYAYYLHIPGLCAVACGSEQFIDA